MTGQPEHVPGQMALWGADNIERTDVEKERREIALCDEMAKQDEAERAERRRRSDQFMNEAFGAPVKGAT